MLTVIGVDVENVLSMQEDELTSDEREAVLNEDKAKGEEIPSENQLSDKTAAEGQEGEPSSPPCSFIYILILIFFCDASCDLQYMCFFQLLMLLCLKPHRPEWPQRSAQMKSFLLKVDKPPVNKVSD